MSGAMQHYKVEDFIKLLMRPGMKLEMRAIRLGGRGVAGQAFVDNAAEAEAFAMKHGRDAEIYMGVAPRTGDKEYGSPRVLWTDIDFKDTPEALARVELMLVDPAPSIVVNSGGGLHVYWILDGEVSEDRVVPMLRRLVRDVGGDMTGAEVARILRLPGTMNHKYRPPRMVTIEEMWPDRAYEEWEFGREEVAVFEKNAYTGPTGGAAALSAARAFMRDREPAIEKQGGDKWTYDTSCVLTHDYGLGEDDVLELLEEWNTRCVPPWSSASLRKKVKNAMRYGKGEVGSSDPERDFTGAAPDILDGPEDVEDGGIAVSLEERTMKALSDRYAVVDDAGLFRIYGEVHDDATKVKNFVAYKKEDFLSICDSKLMLPPIPTGEKKANGDLKYMSAGEYWLKRWRDKETYNGITMMPECADRRTPDGKMNMWRGFGVDPKPGSCERLKEFAFYLLNKNQIAYDYLVNWHAMSAQRPHLPAGVAIVLRGVKGAGKGTLGRAFIRLFGRHGKHVTSRELLTGRFTGHLRDCIALFADEAYWAGDKQGEGQLKGFITEPMIEYEAKGRDPYRGRNCLHIFMASNSDWVVPAGMDKERRFAIFDVNEEIMSNDKIAAVYAEMDNGGLAAWLHYLLNKDLSEFDVRNIPQNEALAEQKLHGMDPIAVWLLEAAENNWEDFGKPETDAGGNWYDAMLIHSSYIRNCNQRNVRSQRSSETLLGIALKKFLQRGSTGKKRIWIQERERQMYHYLLPDAEEAVNFIKKKLGLLG